MNTRILIPTAFMGAALLTGCFTENGNDSQTPLAKARFDIQAFTASTALAKSASGSSDLVMNDTSGIQFNVTEARVFLDKVKLIGDDDDCEKEPVAPAMAKDSSEKEDDSLKVGTKEEDSKDNGCEDGKNALSGPFVVDLLTGATTPDMGAVEVPAGSYHKVKIHLGHAKSSDGIVDSSDPLFGNTLYVKGTYGASGQTAQPFTLALKFDEEVEMEDLAGMELNAATLNTILVSVRMDGWLANLNVGHCLAKPEVMASVSNGLDIFENSEIGRCLDIEKTIKENIRASFEVEDDQDHDGKRHDDDDHDADDDKDDI